MAQEATSRASLGAAARASLMWAGGFTAARDVIQFATMLVLVRLLTPADYGSAALAQSILGLISVLSFGTFALHALQLRDPAGVDWQAQFTAAAVINSVLFCLTLLIAWGLWSTERYHGAALPLAGLASVLLIDIAATLRHRMLETRHAWRRFRLLLITGTVLGSAAGLGIAMAGGGVWALVVQVPLFGLPAAVDLFWHGRWRPRLSWSWRRYRDTARFGLNRMGAAAMARGRTAAEQSLLAAAHDLAALGIFTRSVGLAAFAAGRIGSLSMASLYPVITRSGHGSERFRRHAGLVLRAVSWATAAAATALALTAADVAILIYGEAWAAVIPLLPFAAAAVGLLGIAGAGNSLLLASGAARACLVLDAVSASAGVALAFLLVPRGLHVFLAGLAVHGAGVLGLTLALLWARRGISAGGLAAALVPAAVAGASAAAAVLAARAGLGSSASLPLRLGFELALFAAAYLGTLRLLFEHPLRQLLDVAPGGRRLGRLLGVGTGAFHVGP